MPPPPPDHLYGAYKPSNNMTIRTNPVAMSPQISHRTAGKSRWPTLPPPVPNFPQKWHQNEQNYHDSGNREVINQTDEENDYESGSVLYEQCLQNNENAQQARNYFNYGEPTEEYYRNINMEFLDENDFETTSPPEPCPDTLPKNRPKHSASGYSGQSWLSNETTHSYENNQQPNVLAEQSPINSRKPIRNQSSSSQRSVQSSDESETENNRWPSSRPRRSRSKNRETSNKFRNGYMR